MGGKDRDEEERKEGEELGGQLEEEKLGCVSVKWMPRGKEWMVCQFWGEEVFFFFARL